MSPSSTMTGTSTSEAERCGVQRASMFTNTLLSKGDVGQVKKTTFSNPGTDHVFGLQLPRDPEGAKEVTMHWKAHEPNPHAKPGPDYRAMNKLAADAGLVKASEQRGFRKDNTVLLKKGDDVKKPPPQLPSDVQPEFVYGKPGTHRTAEEVRQYGPADPPITDLVQGAFVREWVDMNSARKHEFDVRQNYIAPSETRATLGHKLGASGHLQCERDVRASWKMSKFTKVPSKVAPYIKSPSSSSAGGAGQGDSGSGGDAN